MKGYGINRATRRDAIHRVSMETGGRIRTNQKIF
jgi:hypothetical protein